MLRCTESPVRVVSRLLLRCSLTQNFRIKRGDNYPDARGHEHSRGGVAEETSERLFQQRNEDTQNAQDQPKPVQPVLNDATPKTERLKFKLLQAPVIWAPRLVHELAHEQRSRRSGTEVDGDHRRDAQDRKEALIDSQPLRNDGQDWRSSDIQADMELDVFTDKHQLTLSAVVHARSPVRVPALTLRLNDGRTECHKSGGRCIDPKDYGGRYVCGWRSQFRASAPTPIMLQKQAPLPE